MNLIEVYDYRFIEMKTNDIYLINEGYVYLLQNNRFYYFQYHHSHLI